MLSTKGDNVVSRDSGQSESGCRHASALSAIQDADCDLTLGEKFMSFEGQLSAYVHIYGHFNQ